MFSRYYNSMFDVVKLAGLNYPESLNETEKYNYTGDLAVHIQRLATTVAQSVYQQAVGSTAPENCSASNVTVNVAWAPGSLFTMLMLFYRVGQKNWTDF